MKLVLSPSGDTPIYAQLKAQIQAAIFSGELQEGEALPSLRAVAKALRISVLTVTRAYTELEQEGFVTNIQGKGCFVRRADNALLQEQRVRQAEERLQEGIRLAKQAGLDPAGIRQLLDILLQEEGAEV